MNRILPIVMLATALLAGCASQEKKSETAFFPALPQQPRLQFLTAISTEADLGGKAASAVKDWLVGAKTKGRQIARAQAIGTSKGKVYVLDRTYKKVLILDLVKKDMGFIKDEREGALGEALGLWVAEDDFKYVADAGRKEVVVFDHNNRFVRAYGDKDRFEKPTAVAVHGNRVYVVDFTKMAVFVLDKESGKVVQTIGEPGEEDGRFNRPTHITVNRAGEIYVNDSFNYRMQKFDAKGNFVKKYGYQGDTLGGFARPKGIAVDRDGFVYAVDAAFENAQIFDGESTDLMLFFGGYGPHAGSMYLPSDIHIDYENVDYFSKFVDKDFKVKYLVYVGNLLGDKKLNVYGFGDWIGAPLPGVPRQRLAPETQAPKQTVPVLR